MNNARITTLLLLILLICVSGTGFQALPESARAQLHLSSAAAANPLNEAPSTGSPSPALAPAPFGKISPIDGSTVPYNGVVLTWEASSSGNVTYQYCLRPNRTSCNKNQWKNVGSNTSTTLVPLTGGATYYWQVRAVDKSNGSITYANGDAYWSFKTALMAPPAAFTKKSPSLGSTGIPLNSVLTWNPSAGTDVHYDYCIYGPALNGNACTTWTSVMTTSAAINGLDYMTTYSWQVRAVNPAGITYADGSQSTVWNFTTLGAPPYPFFKLSPSTVSTDQPLDLVLDWSPSTGAEGYQYCIDTTNNNTCDNDDWKPTTNTLTTNTYAELTGLLPNTQYFWQVKASNDKGDVEADQNPLSAGTYKWFSFTTMATAPAAFDKIAPQEGLTNRSINPYLYWWTPTDPQNTYEYCVSTAASCPAGGWKPIAENVYIHLVDGETLAYATKYYWQVRATKNSVITEADTGTWWFFTTVQAPPTSENQSFTTPEDTTKSGQLALVNTTVIRYFTLVGGLPTGTLVLQSDGTFTYTPPANYNGQVGFRFIVSDGLNLPTGPYTATINVTPVNDAPVLKAIPDLTVTAGDTATFTASATDIDTVYGQTLTYSLVGITPAGVTLDSTTGVFDWSTSETMAPGVYTLTVKVTDSGSPALSDTKTVRITVNPGVPVIYLPILFQQ